MKARWFVIVKTQNKVIEKRGFAYKKEAEDYARNCNRQTWKEAHVEKA